jgi:phosphoribosylaminoimidazole-succinocarboxamide synthase
VVKPTHLASGKVREIYSIDDHHLLFVATDRISAYDCMLEPDIPDKGKVLTGLSLFWFDLIGLDNHFVSTDLSGVDVSLDERKWLSGRSMVVRRAAVIPLECVVRGYLYGSAWSEYAAGGGPTTEHLPSGLEMGSRLEEPVFTPAHKATTGHDQNLTESEARTLVGGDTFETLRTNSLAAYRRAADHAGERGIILADTKFEFGRVDGQIVLIDEVLTPDSSRYWPAAAWAPGRTMPSFDKQYVRDWLDAVGFDRTPPAPTLPDEVVQGTRTRYIEAFERLTNKSFEQYLEENEA